MVKLTLSQATVVWLLTFAATVGMTRHALETRTSGLVACVQRDDEEQVWCAPVEPADVARVLAESASVAGDDEEWITMGYTIPGGRSKGTPLEEASAEDIQFWLKRRKEELEKDPNGQYAEPNRKWIAAAERALGGVNGAPRAGNAAMVPAERSQSQVMASVRTAASVVEAQRVQGTFVQPIEAQRALTDAARLGHLIAPATGIAVMPPGCALAITVVHITELDAYDQKGGKGMRSLGKSALMKLAAAAGISWEVGPHLGRVDNRADQHYCEWRALGYYRAFDGTVMQLPGHKTMDLRDGSAMAKSITSGELEMQRKHIEGHAETKAMLRAVRAIGLRHAYSRQELERPFIVARLMFVGHSEDPVERRMFAEKIADSFLGARTALFGPAPTAAPAMQTLAPAYVPRVAPPPLRQSRDDDDDFPPPSDPRGYEGGYVEANGDAPYEAGPPPAAAAPEPRPTPPQASRGDGPPPPPPPRQRQQRARTAEPPADPNPFDDSRGRPAEENDRPDMM